MVCQGRRAFSSNDGHSGWGIAIGWADTGRRGTRYDVHLGLIGKRVVDFLLVLIELFR